MEPIKLVDHLLEPQFPLTKPPAMHTKVVAVPESTKLDLIQVSIRLDQIQEFIRVEVECTKQVVHQAHQEPTKLETQALIKVEHQEPTKAEQEDTNLQLTRVAPTNPINQATLPYKVALTRPEQPPQPILPKGPLEQEQDQPASTVQAQPTATKRNERK